MYSYIYIYGVGHLTQVSNLYIFGCAYGMRKIQIIWLRVRNAENSELGRSGEERARSGWEAARVTCRSAQIRFGNA